jgi:hypothetical protein
MSRESGVPDPMVQSTERDVFLVTHPKTIRHVIFGRNSKIDMRLSSLQLRIKNPSG